MSQRKLHQQLNNLIKQGRLGTLNDGTKTQEIQAEFLENEVVDDVERFQNYGFTSRPTKGGVLALNMGGRGNHLIAIVINDDDSRVELEEDGDVAIYHQEGHKLVLTKDGVARLTCKKFIVDAEDEIEMNTKTAVLNASESVTIKTPTTTITGDTTVQGHLTFMSGITGHTGGNRYRMGPYRNVINGDITINGISYARDHESSGKSFNSHTHIDSIGGETKEPS